MLLNTGRSFDLEVITPLYYSLRVWGGSLYHDILSTSDLLPYKYCCRGEEDGNLMGQFYAAIRDFADHYRGKNRLSHNTYPPPPKKKEDIPIVQPS